MRWYLITAYLLAEEQPQRIGFSRRAINKEKAIQKGYRWVNINYSGRVILSVTAEQHHPVNEIIDDTTDRLVDERKFSAEQMYDFALNIAQVAMASALKGSKLIGGEGLYEYIRIALDLEEGDNDH